MKLQDICSHWRYTDILSRHYRILSRWTPLASDMGETLLGSPRPQLWLPVVLDKDLNEVIGWLQVHVLYPPYDDTITGLSELFPYTHLTSLSTPMGNVGVVVEGMLWGQIAELRGLYFYVLDGQCEEKIRGLRSFVQTLFPDETSLTIS